MTTHYAGLGDERTACGLTCRPATEDTYTRAWSDPVTLRLAGMGSLDPRLVDCPTCVAELPEISTCACGAPALYGEGIKRFEGGTMTLLPAQWCVVCAPTEVRCQRCRRALRDADDSFCGGCLEGDPIGDAAGDMQEVA